MLTGSQSITVFQGMYAAWESISNSFRDGMLPRSQATTVPVFLCSLGGNQKQFQALYVPWESISNGSMDCMLPRSQPVTVPVSLCPFEIEH